MSRKLLLTVVIGISFLTAAAAEPTGNPKPIGLAGSWRVALDRTDVGQAEQWHTRTFKDKIRLPGSLPLARYGDRPSLQTRWTGGIQNPNWFKDPFYGRFAGSNNFKFPFWLQPETYYVGPAWYQREITVPDAWAGRRVVLFLERPHWETRVWIDNDLIGTNNALGTPHEYELGLLPPGKHRLTIRVDNRMVIDVGPDSHSMTDHTQGNWNGLVGKLELRATAPVWIEELQVFPDIPNRSLKVKGRIGNLTGKAGEGTVRYTLAPVQSGKSGAQATLGNKATRWTESGGEFAAEFPLGRAVELWDEFSPNLYDVTCSLQESGDTHKVRIGFREFKADGTQFVINGRKTFIRGTLECAIFPKTGHPPTEVGEWKRIIRVAQAHGLNNFRFHSWCPPEAAFAAADELGFFLQVEVSSWANSSSSLGDGKPVDRWLYAEADRMLRFYGNHPSFVLMPYGNEPGGRRHAAYLAEWVNHYKTKDPRRLYTSGAGWPQIPENQFHVTPDPRIQGWGAGVSSRINALPPETKTDYASYIAQRKVPVISHEIGQWCVYPNFKEMRKYTGYLKPRNFEIFQEMLREAGMGDQGEKFLLASGKLQTLCYKEDIESALRTPGMGGFQLLDLHDFPGQGTALVGVLDPFWEEKGYVTPAAYSRFCNATVPLARMGKRVFTTAENLQASLEVAHFGPEPLRAVTARWKVVCAEGKVLVSGRLEPRDLPIGNGIALGKLDIPLAEIPTPSHLKLVVGLENTEFENDWDFWVYAKDVDTKVPEGVVITKALDDQALGKLESGGTVVLVLPKKQLRPSDKGSVALGFSSIFWNTAWTHNQPPHTLGVLCDPKHRVFAAFPTDYHSNWQWWYLVSRAGAMVLDGMPEKLRPTVQVIDDWFTNRRLGLLFEARCGKGKLLVSSIEFEEGLADNPVLRQFRHSVLRYAGSRECKPAVEVTAEQVRQLLAEPRGLQRFEAEATADSSHAGYEAAQAIDGDPKTIWHTRYEPRRDPMPHSLVIDLGRETTLRRIHYLPRQDMANGRVADVEIFCGTTREQRGEAVARAKWPNTGAQQTITFSAPVRARYINFVIRAEVNGNPFAAVAEIDVEE